MTTNPSSLANEMPTLSLGDDLSIVINSTEDDGNTSTSNFTYSVATVTSNFADLSTSPIQYGVNELTLTYDPPILNLDDGITILTNLIKDGERISASNSANKASTLASECTNNQSISIRDCPITATNNCVDNMENGMGNLCNTFEVSTCKSSSEILDTSSNLAVANNDTICTDDNNFDNDIPAKTTSTSTNKVVKNKSSLMSKFKGGPNTAVRETEVAVKRKDVKVRASVIKKLKPTGEVWTTEEKRKLYNAVSKYGDRNLKKITALVGNRTLNDVALKLKHYETVPLRKIREEMIREPNGKYREIRLCDDLIRKLKTFNIKPNLTKCAPLATAFKIIELYEEHPDPKDTYGIDFKKAYGWIYDCISGGPTRELDIPTAAYMLKLFDVLMEELDKPPTAEMEEKLKVMKAIIESGNPGDSDTLYPNRRKSKNDKKDIDAIIFNTLLQDKNMNPLGLPAEFWKT